LKSSKYLHIGIFECEFALFLIKYLCKYFLENKIKPCELKLFKLTNFQINRWTAGEKKNFACIVCGLMYGTKNAMYLHVLWKHPDRKFKICRLCDKYIDAVIGMQAHLDEVHGEEISTSLKASVLKCQFCTKFFIGQSRKYCRSQHIRHSHSDIAVRCAWIGCCRYIKFKT
jgi:hypothetical protein